MTVPDPNSSYGGGRRGDHDLGDAPQNHRSNTSSPPIDLGAWSVRPVETPSFTGTISSLLTFQGYTVIPPTPSSSSARPDNLVPPFSPVEGLGFMQGSRLSRPSSVPGVEEHLTEDAPQPDVAPLREVQASAAEASNGEASKSKNKPKKKKKKKWQKKKHNKEQTVCRDFQESGQCRYGNNCKHSHLLPSTLPDTLPLPDDTVNPDPAKEEQDSPKEEEGSPIDLFFATHPGFDYMRNKPLWNEFNRMGQHFKWQGPEKRQVKSEFQTALVEEFNHVYGTDEDSLESWAKLCTVMGLSTPTTLEEAHKIVRGAYVNLVVLVQSPRTCESVELFKSAEDLKKFTAETKWTFSQQHTQAGGLLKMLIRKMGGPSHGHGSRGKKKAVAK